jgi:2'-5' RNA ligase
VALDLPDEVKKEIHSWGRRALDDPALRLVPPQSLHVTLAFLGSRPEEEIEQVAALVRGIAMPAPLIELSDPVAQPSRGRPRLFALPVRSPQAVQLQAVLREKLVAAGLYKPDERRFWPHVTAARVRQEGRGSRRPMSVDEVPGTLPASLRKSFRGVRAVFYRSELQPSGARYVPLAQVELSAEDGS